MFRGERFSSKVTHQMNVDRSHLLHLERLEAINNRKRGAGTIDNNVPVVANMNHMKINMKKKQQDLEYQMKVRRENTILVDRITHLSDHLPSVPLSNHQSFGGTKYKRSLNVGNRRRNIEKINTENEKIAARLDQSKSIYRTTHIHKSTLSPRRPVENLHPSPIKRSIMEGSEPLRGRFLQPICAGKIAEKSDEQRDPDGTKGFRGRKQKHPVKYQGNKLTKTETKKPVKNSKVSYAGEESDIPDNVSLESYLAGQPFTEVCDNLDGILSCNTRGIIKSSFYKGVIAKTTLKYCDDGMKRYVMVKCNAIDEQTIEFKGIVLCGHCSSFLQVAFTYQEIQERIFSCLGEKIHTFNELVVFLLNRLVIEDPSLQDGSACKATLLE